MHIFQPERYLLKKHIKNNSHFVKGSVLDVGSGEYSRYQNLFIYDKYTKLDIRPGANVDVVGTAESIPLGDSSFDCIVCTQVLGDVINPSLALLEFHRVLKPGGVVLLTEGFLGELHDEPNDFFRFTSFGLAKLFENAGFKVLQLEQIGGFFSVQAQMKIRYLINRFKLYKHSLLGHIFSIIFRLIGKLSIYMDRCDRSKINSNFSIASLIVAQKI